MAAPSSPGVSVGSGGARSDESGACAAVSDVPMVDPSGALLYYSSQWSYPAEMWKTAVCAHFEGTRGGAGLDFRCYDPADPHQSLGDVRDIHYALVYAMHDLDCRRRGGWTKYGAPHGLLASLPNLRVTLSIASGIDHVLSDPTYPRDRIPVLRMVDTNQIAMMGEYCTWAVLDHHRAMPRYREQQRNHVYRRINTPYTPAVVVLVLGLGHMGSEIAARLHILGFEVRGWCRTARDNPHATTIAGDGRSAPAPPSGVRCHAGRDALITDAAPGCNYVINALPLTEETKGVLNRCLFDVLAPGACVINVGRGGHVVQSDLLGALASGRLSHAYLDVFDEEPLGNDHPFWDHPQITLTPHVAGELVPRSCAVSVARNIRAHTVR